MSDPAGGDDRFRQNLSALLRVRDLLQQARPESQSEETAAIASDHDDIQIKLTVTQGPHKGKVFRFSGHDTFLVGRSPRAHFQLADKDNRISRLHFMVEVNPPLCRLVDLGSRNGTHVNGQEVKKVDLKTGDRIRVGRTILRVGIVRRARPWSPPDSLLMVDIRPPRIIRPDPVPEPTVLRCQACATGMVTAAPASPAGLCERCWESTQKQPQVIPGYHMIREVGRGGMGVVHQALHTADNALVALKMITPAVAATAQDIARFRREASILYELDHPNIVAFRDVGEADGRLYFAMDFVRGTDAWGLVVQNGPLRVVRAVTLICQVLQALDYAHAKRFVHRDIKPANVLVRDDGDRETAMLADFGLARVYQASKLSGLTMTGTRGGTVAYMPPEQITNFRNAEPASDQYSVGATLYVLLTAKLIHDFPSRDDRQLSMILHDKPVPIRARRSDIPEALESIIQRTLAKDPAKRFPDVKTLRRQLLPFTTSS
jgi:serine/threonine-protein kinase